MKYSKNGAVFYTSTKTPTYPLLVDAALYTQGATLSNAVVSGASAPPPPPPPSGAVPVVWTSAVGVTVTGNSLTKTTATGWGNAGAVSTQQIASGDGYVEFTASETSNLPDARPLQRQHQRLLRGHRLRHLRVRRARSRSTRAAPSREPSAPTPPATRSASPSSAES